MRKLTYTVCDLRHKEVIDVCDGARLGFPEDIVFDECGKVLYLCIGSSGFRFSFSRCEPRQIPWCEIQRITEETIWIKSRH